MGAARLEAAWQEISDLWAPGFSLLDVGCGRGEVLKIARTLGFSPVSGTEVVGALLSQDVVYAEAHRLPFSDMAFDVVTCFDVLEHLYPDDTVPALRELHRVSKCAVVLTAAGYSHQFRGVELHVNRRTREQWQSLLDYVFVGSTIEGRPLAGASWTWRLTQ